jgi:hypothetical protein
MNTPSHAILNLALLTQSSHLSHPFPILMGAVLPDLPIFVLYGWAKLIQRLPESAIWTETYYQPFWQNLTALGHSIPLTSLGFVITALCGWKTPALLFASMVLHSLGDLPVHHDDAHRHFFPFSDYRFISPISYWDPRHHGAIVSLVEILMVSGGSVYLFPKLQSWLGYSAIIGVTSLYWLMYFLMVLRRFAWFAN